MPLKILTGVIVPEAANRSLGTALIDFKLNEVTGDATRAHEKTIGSGRYTHTPGIHFALRDFVAQDRSIAIEDVTEQDRFRIDTNRMDRDRSVVEWECESGAQIREISYLIVGTVVVKEEVDLITPLGFGAVGDGVADDSSALSDAIDAANGKTLDLCGRTYLIDSRVLCNASNGIRVQNGKILCNFATQVESAIRITSDKDIYINNLQIDGQDTAAKLLFLRSNGTTTRVIVDGFEGKNALQTETTGGLAAALYINKNDDALSQFESVHITNSRFINVDSIRDETSDRKPVGRGILVHSCNHTLVTNCHFENIGPYQDGDGIFVNDATSGATRQFVLSNCTFTNCHKRSIKSQVAMTSISNVVCRRTVDYSRATGQSEISLQSGGSINGAALYYENNSAPRTIITSIMRNNDTPLHIRNITISSDDETHEIGSVIGSSQLEDIYVKDFKIENVSVNCRIKHFLSISGKGLSAGRGCSRYAFDDVVIRNVKAQGFITAPEINSSSCQPEYGLIGMDRSATADIDIRFSAYDVQIGTDDTVPTAYLETHSGSIRHHQATLTEHFNCKGFDTRSYNGTGLTTYKTSSTAEYVPNIKYSDLNNGYLAKKYSIAEGDIASYAFDVAVDTGCKVAVLYNSRDTAGSYLYTEGFVNNGQGTTVYNETVAGDKTHGNTGAISITAGGASGDFTVAKTAGSSTGDGKLQVLIWHTGNVTEASDRIFPLESYGATGDGYADEIDALNAAVVAASAAGGGTILGQACAIYKLPSDITIQESNITIDLQNGRFTGGGRIIFDGDSGTDGDRSAMLENIHVRNMRLGVFGDATKCPPAPQFKWCKNSSMENVIKDGVTRTAFDFNMCESLIVRNCVNKKGRDLEPDADGKPRGTIGFLFYMCDDLCCIDCEVDAEGGAHGYGFQIKGGQRNHILRGACKNIKHGANVDVVHCFRDRGERPWRSKDPETWTYPFVPLPETEANNPWGSPDPRRASQDSVFESCTVTGCDGNGFHVQESTRTQVLDCNTTDAGGSGIVFYRAKENGQETGFIAKGCTITNPTQNGITLKSGDETSLLPDGVIDNCTITGAQRKKGGGIHLENTTNTVIKNSSSTGNTRDGIRIENTTNTEIKNSSSTGNTGFGVNVLAGNTAPSVHDCTLTGNGLGGLNEGSPGDYRDNVT